jgi:hypothetical protein
MVEGINSFEKLEMDLRSALTSAHLTRLSEEEEEGGGISLNQEFHHHQLEETGGEQDCQGGGGIRSIAKGRGINRFSEGNCPWPERGPWGMASLAKLVKF